MWKSGEMDFRFRLVESTYPSKRPRCSSLSVRDRSSQTATGRGWEKDKNINNFCLLTPSSLELTVALNLALALLTENQKRETFVALYNRLIFQPDTVTLFFDSLAVLQSISLIGN